MIELKSPAEIALMREAGRVTAGALAAVREFAVPGHRLDELDAVAAEVIEKAGAEPLFLHYHPSWAPTPYPGVTCISVTTPSSTASPGATGSSPATW